LHPLPWQIRPVRPSAQAQNRLRSP
jgi:hypothetical protein